VRFVELMCHDPHAITGCNTGVSLTFLVGGQLIFTGEQTSFDVNISITKTFPLDGKIRQVKSSSQRVNLRGAWPFMKSLITFSNTILELIHLVQKLMPSGDWQYSSVFFFILTSLFLKST